MVGGAAGRDVAERPRRQADLRPVGFPAVTWDDGSRDASLDAVYRWVEAEAIRAIDWYLREKRWKAAWSRVLRVVAVVGATTGAALPFVVRDGNTGFEWGYFSLAMAAGAMALDRFFGFSSGWMRYITAELALQDRLQKLRFTWATTQLDRGGRPLTGEEARDLLATLSEAAAGIAEELRRETLSWAEEFQANVSELRTLAKPA